ncbi:ABC transporter substrate-binding protein [Pontimicrobium sp. MEBiC06410]
MIILLIIMYSCKNQEKTETVNIGAVLSITGKGASVGDYAKKGLELAVEEVNQAGGVLGKKVKLDIQDSKSIGKEGVTVTQKLLLSNTPPDLLYVQLSSVSLPVKPIAEKNRTIMYGLSGSEQLIKNSNYTFRNWVAPWIAGEQLANKIEEKFSPNSVGIFHSNDDFGKSMQKWVSQNLNKKNIKIGFSETFIESSLDYKSLILKNNPNDMDVIYVVGLGQGLGTLIRQLRELNYTGIIVGDITTPFPNVIETAGDYAKGVYYLDFDFDLESNKTASRDFIINFKKRFNKKPKTLSAISYDALMLYFKAVENAGTLDDEKVKIEMNKIKDFNGIFGDISIQNYDIIYPLDFKQIQ